MCGICGFNFNDKSLVTKMANALKHRGPDDKGYFIDENVSLGFRRLSIIDLNTGNQPIFNEQKTTVIIFNGEIYNYVKLREFLEKKGHRFRTSTDTETIIHAYEEYGEDCVRHLRGMFAFAIYDMLANKIFLARDRLGIKPLYYTDTKRFLFASELKSLLKYEYTPREIDKQALHHYLTFGYVPGPRTIFARIKKLLPGYTLTFQDSQIKIKKYWDLEYKISDDNFSTSKEKLLASLKDAVSSHLIADVPIGVFLSGGMDSSTIVALMHNVTDKIRTFSLGFEETDFNELSSAKILAEKFNTQHREFIVTPKIADIFKELVYYADEPFVDPLVISSYYVSKMTSKYVKVALSGNGGDEILAGYIRYLPWKQDKVLGLYKFIPGFIKNRISMLNSEANFARKLKKINSLSQMAKEEQWMSKINLFNEEEKQSLYSSPRQYENSFQVIKQYMDSSNSHWLNKMLYVDLKTFVADNTLPVFDRMSMMNSLEVRVPLLDHNLVEYTARINPAFKLSKNTTKFILKEVMKELLPKEIIQKPKQGFDVPIKHWIKDELAPDMELAIREIEKSKLFNVSYIRKLYSQHMENKRDNSRRLWALLCFNKWAEIYNPVTPL